MPSVLQVDLLALVSDAWLHTTASQRGLFRTGDASVSVNPSADEPEGGPEPTVKDADGIVAHHLWALFLLEVSQARTARVLRTFSVGHTPPVRVAKARVGVKVRLSAVAGCACSCDAWHLG